MHLNKSDLCAQVFYFGDKIAEKLMPHKLSIETVLKDLDCIKKEVRAVGAGAGWDKAAYLILLSIKVLERRLGESPETVQAFYVDSPDVPRLLPRSAQEIARQYICGSITETEAQEKLQDISQQYRTVFRKIMMTPRESDRLYLENIDSYP